MYGEYILIMLCLVLFAHVFMLWRLSKDAGQAVQKAKALNENLERLQEKVQSIKHKRRIRQQGYADETSRLN